ncbi:MAG: SDR family oxidoreductase [Chloroflexota bacterium]|nr:SDR family oxidoreductase [Chloroflexota bacterium]
MAPRSAGKEAAYVNRLQGLRCIVTGAGSGIGRAIALRFAAEGARVLVADLDEAAGRSVAQELGGPALSCRVDVSQAGQVWEMVGLAEREWGGLDALVNNAGIGISATTPATEEADWDRLMAVNLRGTFLGMKYGIPVIRDSGGGTVTNISSIAAVVGVPDRAAYCASKGGVLALTRAAAIDHIGEGVRINAILPGTVETPWIDRITEGYNEPEAARAAMQARQPHGRFVQPEEIAAMAAYLASPEAASVVGAAMVVDGGMTAR